MQAIKNIIFDLGGVVMNIDFKRTEQAFADLGFTDFARYMTQYHITPFFEEYETGRINNSAFITGIQKIASAPLQEQQIVDAWNALLLDFPQERLELLTSIKPHYRTFLLSNTNALHHDAFQEKLFLQTGMRLESFFEKVYFSHTTKMRKPGAPIFQMVIDENGLIPSETLFIDDTASNLTGAIETGMRALHLKAPQTIDQLEIFRQP